MQTNKYRKKCVTGCIRPYGRTHKELMEERSLHGDIWQERLDACKTIRTKL